MSTNDASKQHTESAQKCADRAHEAAIKHDHAGGGEQVQLLGLKAETSEAEHMLTWAKQWDKAAARQRRLAAIQKAKP